MKAKDKLNEAIEGYVRDELQIFINESVYPTISFDHDNDYDKGVEFQVYTFVDQWRDSFNVKSENTRKVNLSDLLLEVVDADNGDLEQMLKIQKKWELLKQKIDQAIVEAISESD